MGSPKIMTPKRLFSPTKSSPLKMSPVKAPAHQRFQHLIEQGTPTLQLPFKYRYLLEIFKAVDTVCVPARDPTTARDGDAGDGPLLHPSALTMATADTTRQTRFMGFLSRFIIATFQNL